VNVGKIDLTSILTKGKEAKMQAIRRKQDEDEKKPNPKGGRIKQSEIPKYQLDECIKLAQSLFDEFNGEAAPHQLAIAFGISPTSSAWQYITGACVAYGLTEGAYNAAVIRLTDLGRRIVATTVEGDDVTAKVEAALRPTIIRQFYQKYDKGKFPSDKIAQNVLLSMGVPKDRLKDVYDIISNAGEVAGIIHRTKTGLYVAISTPSSGKHEATKTTESGAEAEGSPDQVTGYEKEAESVSPIPKLVNNRVFISHGKNKAVVEQLKELLTFGKFMPVVAVEHETPSKPVSDKVMEDMRSCFAGVIHVESEEEVLDREGKTLHKINENVLIEIGAAMALYGNNFVLLVQKGIHLPSNLQGLYRCDYEGEKLDYPATMKLLKAFNEFK
jgi:hypothetical protein